MDRRCGLGSAALEMADFTDIIAVFFLIWNTVRKLDIQKQRAEDFPHVDPRAFAEWRKKELFAYSLGAYASIAKLVLNFAWIYAITRYAPPAWSIRVVGMSIFFGWGIALIISALMGTKGRAMRGDLGIALKSRREG
ncbi:MAG: hypothetical protein R3B07_32840 [Polyangiaceae bacterium]